MQSGTHEPTLSSGSGGDGGSPLVDGVGGSLLLAAGVFLLLLPQTAVTPQSGDGAELVNVALHGGVPHPPGFPLYAWLARAYAALPFGAPATRLALLSLTAHAGAVFFLSEALRALRVSLAARLFGVFTFALFPTVWVLALQPEVFGGAHLAMAAALFVVVSLAQRPPGMRDAVALGLVGALGATLHTVFAVVLPALLVGVVLVLRPRQQRGARLLGLSLASLPPFAALYASLPLLAAGALWPSWGRFESVSDVVGHMLRRDYGTFHLQTAAGGAPLSALRLFGEELLANGHFFVVFAPLGLLALTRQRQRAVALALAGTLVAALVFLAVARFGDRTVVAMAYLERFFGTAVLPSALLGALGLDLLRERASARMRKVIVTVVALGVVTGAALEWDSADLSGQRAHAIHQELLAAQLDEDALYLASSDLESFAGVARPDGSLRFPVSRGVLGLDWYREGTLLRLEPRLVGATFTTRDGAPQPHPSMDALVRWAHGKGLKVASTRRDVLEGSATGARLEGLLWVAYPSPTDDLGPPTALRALAMCPALASLEPLPSRGQGLSVPVFVNFARAFDGAAAWWRTTGELELAASAKEIARALESPRGPPLWREACARLEEIARVRLPLDGAPPLPAPPAP